MFRYSTIIAVFLLFMSQLAAQLPCPGGVPGQVVWCVSESHSGKTMFKRIHLTGTKEVLAFSNIQNETDLINFNAAMYFDGKQQPIRLPLGQGLLNKLSIFSVFIPTDDLEEQCLWQLERNSRNELMLTTQRLADMESRYFLEIKGARKGQPMLSVYERHLKPDTLPIVSQCLIVGAQPVLPETPVQAFRGHIAEIIVYDWVLSPVERRQVETYLAIKYGIPLEPYKNAGYYDAASHKVKQNKDFLYRTAGIGRDDASGLYQKQSSGIEEPELLKLFVGSLALSNAANQSEVPDKTYLLWSDNGATLRLNAPRPGMPAMIGRSWEMTVSTDSPNISTTLRFDTRRTNSSRKPEDTWWVVCDQGGRGRFNPETTLYTPASSVSAEGLSVFTNLIWDADRSGSDVFSIAVAPHMFAKYWIDPPMCKSEKNGQLYIGAEGGSLPYRFKLLELNGDFCKEWTTIDHNFERIEGIEPGEYLLSVFDDQGRAFHDTLWVQSSDAPVAQLPSRYELEQGKSIILDAAQHFIPTPGTIFSWSGPQGFLQEGSLISISLPGIYLLSIEHDGCVSRQQIEVVAQQGSVFKGLRLFPNPAPNGRFSIMIDLIRPEAVTIRITDAVGRIVAEQSLRGSDYYFHQFIQALPSGLYQITFQSSSEMQTIPLIIQSN